MKKTAAIIISIGSALAMIGELNPVMSAFYGSAYGNQALQIELISNSRTAWMFANAMMVIGGFIAAVGLWRFAVDAEFISEKQNIKRAAFVSAGLALLGASIHLFMRFVYDILQSPEQYVSGLSSQDWMGTVYTLSTLVAIFIITYILIQTGYSKKLGVAMIVIKLIFVALMGLYGPPAINNLAFLVMGLTLLFKSSPSD